MTPVMNEGEWPPTTRPSAPRTTLIHTNANSHARMEPGGVRALTQHTHNNPQHSSGASSSSSRQSQAQLLRPGLRAGYPSGSTIVTPTPPPGVPPSGGSGGNRGRSGVGIAQSSDGDGVPRFNTQQPSIANASQSLGGGSRSVAPTNTSSMPPPESVLPSLYTASIVDLNGRRLSEEGGLMNDELNDVQVELDAIENDEVDVEENDEIDAPQGEDEGDIHEGFSVAHRPSIAAATAEWEERERGLEEEVARLQHLVGQQQVQLHRLAYERARAYAELNLFKMEAPSPVCRRWHYIVSRALSQARAAQNEDLAHVRETAESSGAALQQLEVIASERITRAFLHQTRAQGVCGIALQRVQQLVDANAQLKVKPAVGHCGTQTVLRATEVIASGVRTMTLFGGVGGSPAGFDGTQTEIEAELEEAREEARKLRTEKAALQQQMNELKDRAQTQGGDEAERGIMAKRAALDRQELDLEKQRKALSETKRQFGERILGLPPDLREKIMAMPGFVQPRLDIGTQTEIPKTAPPQLGFSVHTPPSPMPLSIPVNMNAQMPTNFSAPQPPTGILRDKRPSALVIDHPSSGERDILEKFHFGESGHRLSIISEQSAGSEETDTTMNSHLHRLSMVSDATLGARSEATSGAASRGWQKISLQNMRRKSSAGGEKARAFLRVIARGITISEGDKTSAGHDSPPVPLSTTSSAAAVVAVMGWARKRCGPFTMEPRCITVEREDGQPAPEYAFDAVLSPGASQEEVFMEISAAVNDVMVGFVPALTCIAYGPSRSGKSSTMFCGPESTQFDDFGLAVRTTKRVFEHLTQCVAEGSVCRDFTIEYTFIAVHSDKIFDLLSVTGVGGGEIKRTATMAKLKSAIRTTTTPMAGMGRGGGRSAGFLLPTSPPAQVVPHIKEAVSVPVASVEEATNVLQSGLRSASGVSDFASLVLMVTATSTLIGSPGTDVWRFAFVELPASDVQRLPSARNDPVATKAAMGAAQAVQKTLKALWRGAAHLPFRDAKVTTLLSDLIGPKARTYLFSLFNTDAVEESVSSIAQAAQIKAINPTLLLKRKMSSVSDAKYFGV